MKERQIANREQDSIASPEQRLTGRLRCCSASAIDVIGTIAILLEHSGDGIVALDTEWRYTYVNANAAALLHCEPASLIGKVVWEEFPHLMNQPFYARCLKARKATEVLEFDEHDPMLERWFESRFCPTSDGLVIYFRDVTARRAAEESLRIAERAAEERQRRFLSEVLYSVTDGCLNICDTETDLPRPLPVLMRLMRLTNATLSSFRNAVMYTATACNFPKNRAGNLLWSAGEAALNAVVHAGHGEASIFTNSEGSRIQVWVRDEGNGIAADLLHRATLENGFTTVGSFGYGFAIMLQTADVIHLRTGPEGTTIVLEVGVHAPKPDFSVH